MDTLILELLMLEQMMHSAGQRLMKDRIVSKFQQELRIHGMLKVSLLIRMYGQGKYYHHLICHLMDHR